MYGNYICLFFLPKILRAKITNIQQICKYFVFISKIFLNTDIKIFSIINIYWNIISICLNYKKLRIMIEKSNSTASIKLFNLFCELWIDINWLNC